MTKSSKPAASSAKTRGAASGVKTGGSTGGGSTSGGSKPRGSARGGSASSAAQPGTRKPSEPQTQAQRRAQSKKIVNKRQTPWGLIVATALIVVVAVGVIGYAVAQNTKKNNATDPNRIAGIEHVQFPGGQHQTGVIKYAQSPPIGGPHNPTWADCTGTVYPAAIANENAVHSMEHGAVWITYKPGLPSDQVDKLQKLVAGNQFMLMSPYEGLKSNVSLQSWGYQLFVDSATDSRVKQFVDTMRLNPKTTPELGASCTNAAFKTTPSTPGHPTAS
jgi:hypothetical protein